MRYTVPAPISLGECLARLLGEASGRTRKQMLADGRVRVNGAVDARGTTALAAGDVVEIGAKVPREPRCPPGSPLVHEDDDVIVVDKPAGLLTIATERERKRTAYAHLMAHARARRPPGRVFVVHRLDRLASGLLVFAISAAAKQALQAQFAAHTVGADVPRRRRGTGLARPRARSRAGSSTTCPGRVRETRDPERGRPAVTHWRVRRTARRPHAARGPPRDRAAEPDPRPPRRARAPDRRRRAPTAAGRIPSAAWRCTRSRLGFDHPRTGVRLRFESPRARGVHEAPLVGPRSALYGLAGLLGLGAGGGGAILPAGTF